VSAIPINASAPPVQKTLTICTSLKSGHQIISKSGKCNERIYESRTWYQKGAAPSGTPGSDLLDLRTCVSKRSNLQMILIRSACNSKTQTTSLWQRPLGPPVAPSITSVAMGLQGTATLNISASADDGGARVTSYLVTSNPGDVKALFTPNKIKAARISGLAPGNTYSFTVVAINSKGSSPASISSKGTIAPTIPSAPTITKVVATGTNTAQLTFTAPINAGGSPITSYVARTNPGGLQTTVFQSASGTINISNLTHSTSYTFTLVANNAAGTSPESANSSSITTATPPPPPAPVVAAPVPTPTQTPTPTPTVIAVAAIAGVTAPVTSATPVTTTTAGTGYTGTVSWRTGGPPLVGNFAGATTYTAIITLTATAGYTLTGVAANFFTVAGATSVSHSADSGEITAVFPATIKLTQTVVITNFPTDIAYGVSPIALAAVSTSGLSVAFTTATSLICTVSGTTLTILTVGTCTINANQAGNTNFAAASQVSGSFTISKATPSLSNFAHISKNVGDASFDLAPPSVANSLPGAFSYTSATTATATISGQTVTIGSAGSTLVTATFTPTDSTRYNNATITMTLSVGLAAQATLSITSLTTNTKAYPYTQALSITTSGGSGTGATTFAIASGGTATGCALSNPTSTATITATSVGTCLIQASKAADSTYSATTSPTVTFTFTTATQTITFATPSAMTLGGFTQTVAPTASSSLTVTLTSTTTGICTVAGFVITALATGTCSITASQTGNSNYLAASDVIQSFAIKATQTITFATPSGMSVGGSTQTVTPTASSSLTVTLTSTTTGVCSVAGFVITAVATGTCSITASQTGNSNYLAANDEIQSFAISGPASGAAITTQPAGAGSGSVLGTQPVIRIVDSGGNTVTSSTVNVVASIASGTGTLSGTTTIAASSGIATFTNLVVTGTAGAFTLTFTPTSLTAATSNNLTITAGPASKVAITRASVGTERRTAFSTQPQITIRDASNNTVTSSTAVVTASITSGAGGSLVGTTTATASSGLATFIGLGLDGTIGTTYTITYTVSDLTVATATVTLTGTTCDGIFTCQVGDTGPGGGKIFYAANMPFNCGASSVGSIITPKATTTCYYLEVAPSNWNGGSDPTKLWAVASNQGTNIPDIVDDATAYNNSLGIGRGLQNSLYIVAQGNDTTTAAGAARGYTVGPINDWYLPTTAELNLLCQWANGNAPSVTTRCTGGSLNSSTYGAASAGFVEAFYYSSSERDAYDYGVNMAWMQHFSLGNQASTPKTSTPFVRPIRAFGVPITISVAAISGVTAPVTGAMPVSTTTAGTGYTGTVSWSGSPSTFAAATVYTATITLTPTAGYTLTGVTANFFTVSGGAPVTHSANSGVITAVFYMVGSTGPGGGEIFYLNPGGFNCGPTRTNRCSYLEAAPSGWRNGGTPANDPQIAWATNVNFNRTTVTGANRTAIGSGYQNSIDIVNQAGNEAATSAAVAAREYRGPNNVNDWYLPSKDELLQMCKWARGQAWESDATTCSAGGSINTGSAAGFVENTPYWSSSEVSSREAWAQYLIGDSQQELEKFYGALVRPIRAFGP
jgi:hypothetical protein